MPDAIGPVLRSLTFQPSVDLRNGIAPFTMSVSATADTPITFIQVLVDHTINFVFSPGNPPSTAHADDFYFSHGVVTQADRDFQQTVTLDLLTFNAAGTYNITAVRIYSAGGEGKLFTPGELQAMGFSTSFTVLSFGGIDTEAPRLTSLTIPTIDVRNGFARCDFAAGATDNQSGVSKVELSFDRALNGPSEISNTRFGTITFYDTNDSFSDGVSHVLQGFQGDNATGTVPIVQAVVTDNAGNSRTYSNADLRAAGLQSSIEIVSSGVPADTTPPRLTQIEAPTVIDLRQGPYSGPITLSATDPSGVASAILRISGTAPAGYFDLRFGELDTFADGRSTTTLSVPTSTPGGRYTVDTAVVKDFAGNTLYSPPSGASLFILNNGVDLTRPRLTALDFTVGPTSADGRATLDLGVGAVTDVNGGHVYLARVSITKDGRLVAFLDATEAADSFADARSVVHSSLGAAGHYEISNVTLYDQINSSSHSSRTYSAAELGLLGFRTGFDVAPQGASPPGTAAAETLGVAVHNILRAPANDALATSLAQRVTAGTMTLAQAQADVASRAAATTSVATLTYEFFTGKAPSEAGMDYLVAAAGPNTNNLNSAYYQSFNLENRYINFAVNLGKAGEGRPAFDAAYGSLDLLAATQKAYAVIFGAAPADAKAHALLDSTLTLGGHVMTRAEYFAGYGGDGLNGQGTKAAMVGWLLAEAVKADLGVYAKSNDAFIADLMDGATFGVDIVGTYSKPEYIYLGG